MYQRPVFKIIQKRLQEPRRFIQILAGPRQTGKTTLACQIIDSHSLPSHYSSADEPGFKGNIWIEQQWEIGRRQALSNKALLILDEIQKIADWSETVKKLWDQDTKQKSGLQVMLLGSSPLLLQKGLSDSLAGRFELIPVNHWSFTEMQTAFSWDIDQYIFYGGYPGAAELISDHERWSNYILNSLIETSIFRDILLLTRVDKPALLKRLFEFGCSYSGQILSYQKMLGQLQEAGNTTTLAHYLDLLENAGLIAGLSKYSGLQVRQRGSSPKLQVLNTALASVQSHLTLKEARQDGAYWGRLTESSVGAHLANSIRGKGLQLNYWNERNLEVDFVLVKGNRIAAIEVKSGQRKNNLPGMASFAEQFKVRKKWLVGADGIPIIEFLKMTPDELLV
jgi:uncharacterized protein